MRRLIFWILGPLDSDADDGSLSRQQRYAYMQRLLMTLVSIAIIVPMAVTAMLSYYQYGSLSENETRDKLSLDALSAKRSFEFHIQESLSTMAVVAQGYEYGQLFDQANLEALFRRMNGEYWWVVDMGALDKSGIQRAYAGPYPFQGVDYSGQEWFQSAYARKKYVSDVFTGYRGAPHFVETVTNGAPGSDTYWMLRASIDSEHLANYISTINTDAATDMFLVGTDGYLRTHSSNHGDIGDPVDLTLPPATGNINLVEEERDGSSELVAYTKLEGMPWVLVLERQGFVHGDNWDRFRFQLIALIMACGIVALYIAYRGNRYMINMIKRADNRRDEILAEAQHSAKLASVGQLAAGVAHEINNPLAIINEKVGLIRDLTQKTEDFEQRNRILELTSGAADAVNRCKDITHRLLGFARRMDVKKEPLQLNDVILEVVSFVEKEAMYRNITIELDLEEDIPLISSDRGQLQQIFLNIINNAIDAVDKDGKVKISTSVNDSGIVRTIIRDTGPGIPPNIINHIFEPFFTTKTKGDSSRGTGLGLSITYGLVKKLCGQIKVESHVGVGAAFVIDFPIDCDLVE